jgi:hypothetical protein
VYNSQPGEKYAVHTFPSKSTSRISFRTAFTDLGLFSFLGESPMENILLEIPMMNLFLKIENQPMRKK